LSPGDDDGDGMATALPILERGDGAAEIGFIHADGRTRLADLYQRAPCRVLTPREEPGDLTQAVLLTTSGGLADGDRIAIDLRLGEGAAALVTSQAAEKIYGARLAAPATIRVGLTVGAGAWCEWLPQETILFEGARLDRRTVADVAPGGRLLACEFVVFGRLAHGERFGRGLLHDGWELRRGGRLVWKDVLRLDGDIAGLMDSPYSFAGAESAAMVVYVADDAAGHLQAARALLEASETRCGATVVNGLLIVRWFGAASAVRRSLTIYLAAFRAEAGGLPARLPRVWSC
jgi:urease accessory protein